MKKKILFFIPTLSNGGAERVVSILSSEFAKIGHDVKIVVFNDEDISYELNKNVSVVRLFYNEKTQNISFLRRILSIRSVIKNNNPDYVISFLTSLNTNVALASIGLKCKLIVSERNDPNQINKLNRLKRDLAYLFVDKFVFQTKFAKRCFPKRIQKKSHVILNPIVNKFPPKTTSINKIVSVGRLVPQKNYPLLLKSFANVLKIHKDFVLEIYGTGPLKQSLIDLCDKLNISKNVRFMGFKKNVHNYISDSYMYVMSSDFEGLPNSLLEAMCMGLPCISTDCPCGGPAEIIENNINALLVPVGDVNKLTQAILYYIDYPDDAKRISNEAVKLSTWIDCNVIVKQWLSILE